MTTILKDYRTMVLVIKLSSLPPLLAARLRHPLVISFLQQNVVVPILPKSIVLSIFLQKSFLGLCCQGHHATYLTEDFWIRTLL